MEEETEALHDSQKYQLSPLYKDWFAPGWRNWKDAERKERHILNFRSALPSIESSFVKPLNAGRKPGNLPRTRLLEPPTHVVERHEPPSMTTIPSFVATSTATTTTSLASSSPTTSLS